MKYKKFIGKNEIKKHVVSGACGEDTHGTCGDIGCRRECLHFIIGAFPHTCSFAMGNGEAWWVGVKGQGESLDNDI